MKTDSPFHYTKFFESAGIFSEWFTSYENVWEALPDIEKFITDFKNSDKSREYEMISQNVYVGRDVTIDETAKIAGGAIIGHGTTIGHAAYVRGNCLVGEGVNIGHATEVKHSVILSNTALAHLNYIGDSIVGMNVNVSGGATLANWRFDKKEVGIKFENSFIATGMEKMGSIVGDDSFIGVSAVLNPGTVLAKGSLVYPLVSVKGTHLTQEVFK